MANPTAVFSIIAHEAWDHKLSDGENDDDEHNTNQRPRRRYGVSRKDFFFYINRCCYMHND